MDFVIIYLEDKVEVPLILGWSFLATSQALTLIKDVWIVLQVEDVDVTFKH